MADIGTLFTIGGLIKKAYDIYAGCKEAPEEIRLAADHVHGMAVVLEDVRANLVDNKRSYVNQKNNAMAQTQTHNLKMRVQHCERALMRTDNLLRKYHSFNHISGWQKFTWSTKGKAEIAITKEDLLMALMLLDTYINSKNSGALYRVERTLEILMQKFDILAGLQPPPASPNRSSRPRRTSNVGRTLVLSLIIARLRKVLLRYRRKKRNSTRTNSWTNSGNRAVPKPASKRPGALTRVPSGFTNNKNPAFNVAIGRYATSIANSPSTWSTKPQASHQRAKTPDGRHTPRPGPIRRTSSMTKLMGRIHASAQRPRPSTSHYECWKVGIARLAIGPKTPPQFIAHKRGQAQLRKMAAVFQEASVYDQRGLQEQDSRVKALLESRNQSERKKGGNRKWRLITARVVARDPGRTGMVSVEKAVVILARR